MIHIDFAVTDDCINPSAMGEICVWCNACGRVDKATHIQSQITMYKEELQREYEFDGWIEGMEDTQRQNVAKNIAYYKKKIAELEVGE